MKRGYGITNLVARATATADALSAEELIQGRQHQLKDLARLFQNLREATEEDI